MAAAATMAMLSSMRVLCLLKTSLLSCLETCLWALQLPSHYTCHANVHVAAHVLLSKPRSLMLPQQ